MKKNAFLGIFLTLVVLIIGTAGFFFIQHNLDQKLIEKEDPILNVSLLEMMNKHPENKAKTLDIDIEKWNNGVDELEIIITKPIIEKEPVSLPKKEAIPNIDITNDEILIKEKFTVNLPRNIVVIAPHPDDEILCCANVLRQELKKHSNIKIIYITSGDALGNTIRQNVLKYSKIRKKESILATSKLGIREENLFFLGFPDSHLKKLIDGENKVVISKFTKQKFSSLDSHFPQTPYTRKNLKKNLNILLNRMEPTVIYIPSPKHDVHEDHYVTGKIIQEILQENKNLSPDVYYYIIHGNPCPLGKTNNWKLNLIKIFKSQFHSPEHWEFMKEFAQRTEHFGKNNDIGGCGE